MSDDRAPDPERTRNHLELAARWADELAHEVKNPFHAMVINLELVKRRAGDPEKLRERAEVVESELTGVHDLVDSLLKLVRPWPDANVARANTVFAALMPVIRARARLRQVEYDHEPDDAPVPLPPADLALIVLNLLDNAIDAAGVGGRVATRVSSDDAGVRIRVLDSGPGTAGLTGRDDGPGDPFEPGVTARAGHSGLGLAVCRRLARNAGGDVVLERTDDGRTAAILSLPRPGD